MAIKLITQNHLELATLEVRGSLTGDDDTDKVKAAALDLLEQGNRKLVIDLGQVSYINSSGIGALVHIFTSYTREKGKVKLCRLGKSVENVFVITRLLSVFDVTETRAEALKSFESPAVSNKVQ